MNKILQHNLIKGNRCSKLLWNILNNEDLNIPIKNKAKTKVKELFQNVKEIESDIPLLKRFEITKETIIDNNLFNAVFIYENIVINIDYIEKIEGKYNIYLFKCTNWNEKKNIKKDLNEQLKNLMLQKYVLEKFNIEINKIFITMLDSNYYFENELELNKLYLHLDVTDEINESDFNIEELLSVNKKINKSLEEPKIKMGIHCKKAGECELFENCKTQNNIPNISIFNILNSSKKSWDLIDKGIVNIKDIPEGIASSKDQEIIDYWKSKSSFVNKKELKSFLDNITEKIFFLDFETYTTSIPDFPKQKPGEQTLFQYSVHISDEENNLSHKEFLADDKKDSREELIKQLIIDLGDSGSILVYNETFEKGRLKDFIKVFPKYSVEVEKIIERIIDLAKPFKNKYFYDYRLLKKWSIKDVMPLLVPEMENAYKELELVQNGGDAMNIFPKLKYMEEEEKNKYKKALLEYCKLDTLSMVKIFERLKKEIK